MSMQWIVYKCHSANHSGRSIALRLYSGLYTEPNVGLGRSWILNVAGHEKISRRNMTLCEHIILGMEAK
jgi:hypothetical protein